jgi:hypothetical protein
MTPTASNSYDGGSFNPQQSWQLILLPSSTINTIISNGGVEPMKKKRRSVEREADLKKRKKNKMTILLIFLGFTGGVSPCHRHKKGGNEEFF